MTEPLETRRKDRIRQLLEESLRPSELEIRDVSAAHRGHRAWKQEGETHFQVRIVSAEFRGLSLVARHRLVQDALRELFMQGLHALRLRTIAPPDP